MPEFIYLSSIIALINPTQISHIEYFESGGDVHFAGGHTLKLDSEELKEMTEKLGVGFAAIRADLDRE